MRRLLPLTERIIKLRTIEEGKIEDDRIDAEEEAEEDLIAENTHLGILSPQKKNLLEK